METDLFSLQPKLGLSSKPNGNLSSTVPRSQFLLADGEEWMEKITQWRASGRANKSEKYQNLFYPFCILGLKKSIYNIQKDSSCYCIITP